MKFLGTGAAEMYPNPYCGCEVCRRVRNTGEAPRLRSSFMIDEHNLIDFGTDILAASSLYNSPLSAVDHVFITHTHEDHFSLENIGAMTMADKRSRYPIRFYLSAKACDWLNQYMESVRSLYEGGQTNLDRLITSGRLQICRVTPYEAFQAGNLEVFSVESNHRVNRDEYALNYLFDLGAGKKLFYVADSGLYSGRNLDALKGAKADILIMEGTFGSIELERDSSHLNAEHFVEQVGRFADAGIIKPDAKIYVTHINQCNTFTHGEYQSYLKAHSNYDITVAYDGMVIGA